MSRDESRSGRGPGRARPEVETRDIENHPPPGEPLWQRDHPDRDWPPRPQWTDDD